MKQENVEFFLVQSDKLVSEVFELFAKDFFERTEVKVFKNQIVQEQNDQNQIQAADFYSLIAREQITEELKKNNSSAFISRSFSDADGIYFFLIYYDSKKEKIVKRYKRFCDCLNEAIFDFLIEEWNNENFYFYNNSQSQIIVHQAVDTLVTNVSKKCSGYDEIAIYENINLSLLNILSDLSYQTYEKNKAQGLIYFTDSFMNADFQFKFQNYEDFGFFTQENRKLIRKLLQLTDCKKGLGIISDTNRIYGIGKIKDCDVNYSVQFQEDHKWVLLEHGEEIISMKNNNLLFSRDQISREDFGEYVAANIDGVEDEDLSNLYEIIKSLLHQRKGTILVVMKDAKKYINRYKDLAMLIDPVKLDDKNVEKLSSIDGAILVDEKCMCYGFGIVLDGIDTGYGNRARGARYNSSERFYEWCKNQENEELFIFVLSDDGNFNFFPEM